MWPAVGRYVQTVTALKLQATLTKYWVTDKLLLLDSLELFLRCSIFYFPRYSFLKD